MKKQATKKLSRQIKCVKMMSEPLTDEQNTIMQVAMETRLPVLNDFYGRYSGIRNLGRLDARKIRDALKSEKPSEQFGCTVRLWTMALFDAVANIKSAWSNLANRLKALIRDNDDLAESEKDYLRYVVKSPSVWGDILCGRVVQKQSTSYRKLALAVDKSRMAHLHNYLRRITRREKARIPHSSTCRTLYLDEEMYDFSDGLSVQLLSRHEKAGTHYRQTERSVLLCSQREHSCCMGWEVRIYSQNHQSQMSSRRKRKEKSSWHRQGLFDPVVVLFRKRVR